LVVYHSSTGNTRFGVDIIRQEIEKNGGTCRIKKVAEALDEAVESYDLIGVASPVFGFQPAFHLQDFLQTLPTLPGRLGFVFCSYSIASANVLITLGELLKMKGVSVIGAHAMRGEEAWPPLRFPAYIHGKGRPNLQDARAVQDFARGIIQNYREWKELPPESVTQSSDANSAESGLLVRSPAFDNLTRFITPNFMHLSMGRVTVMEDRCIRCGLCAAECPVGAIELQPYPVTGRDCIGCWGCFNLCPQKAIASNLARNRIPYSGMREYQKMQIEKQLDQG
jgi:ferredoxin/flavodoxin